MKASQNKDNSAHSWQANGQLGAKKILQNFLDAISVSGENLPHAFLFLGPRATGKYELAKEFAQKLVHNLGNQSEIFEFDFETANSLDDLRELIKFSNLTATDKSAKKIFLLRNFQDASIGGQNTLLKTLEEPSSSSLFILVSDNNSELPTIMSRCVPIRCYASGETQVENSELQTYVEQFSKTKTGWLVHLKNLQEMETKDLQMLMQLWVEKLLSLMPQGNIAKRIKQIRIAQIASEDLQKNYNTKLILQEFLLQTEKLA